MNKLNCDCIRHIDDAGKIHIPDDIREQLSFKIGDQLIWSVEDGYLKLSKYYVLDKIKEVVKRSAYAIGAGLHLATVICNTDKILAVYGLAPDLVGKHINKKLVESGTVYDWSKFDEKIQICPTFKMFARFICPIIYEDDIIGAIAVVIPQNFNIEVEEFVAEDAIEFLKYYAEYLANELKEVNE